MHKLVQVLLYGVFCATIAYFSVSPTYRFADPDFAAIKLSFSHAANRVAECIKLTPQEINERARRGERINVCERERLPLTVELDIDGETMLSVIAAPSGLWNDGPASVYERMQVTAGPHRVSVRLRDSARREGWDYEHAESITLRPGRYFTITFRAENGGFEFR